MLKLQARRRVGLGKGAGRRVRDRGLIPAVMYGGGGESVSLALEPKAVKEILLAPMGQNTLFSVEVDGGETVAYAIVKDFQKHPVRRNLLHCDILRVDKNLKRKWRVPLVLEGESPAQKLGAKCRFVTRVVVLNAKPEDVPVAIAVSIDGVDFNGIVRLDDVEAPEGTELLYNQNAPVFSAGGVGSIETDEDEDGDEDEDEAAEGEEAEGAAEG